MAAMAQPEALQRTTSGDRVRVSSPIPIPGAADMATNLVVRVIYLQSPHERNCHLVCDCDDDDDYETQEYEIDLPLTKTVRYDPRTKTVDPATLTRIPIPGVYTITHAEVRVVQPEVLPDPVWGSTGF